MLDTDGDKLGSSDGDWLGLVVGDALGLSDGDRLGSRVGDLLGPIEGRALLDGVRLGASEGDVLGAAVGCGVGGGDGDEVVGGDSSIWNRSVGEGVGFFVGYRVAAPMRRRSSRRSCLPDDISGASFGVVYCCVDSLSFIGDAPSNSGDRSDGGSPLSYCRLWFLPVGATMPLPPVRGIPRSARSRYKGAASARIDFIVETIAAVARA